MSSPEWEEKSGIFILVNLQGELTDTIHEIQKRFDPRMANFAPPHFTLIGSSGAGPIASDTPLQRLHEVLDPIAKTTAPLSLHFERPVRYMQTNTFALPLDPHGPLRALHDRVKRTGLSFARSRHAFTPHVTLSHYRTPTDAEAKELLSMRIDEPFVVDHLVVSLTEVPNKPRKLFELELTG
ncbi:MAG TPA: 2'-5' RNA ligase family protein [Gemmatimonadaceae bacterium]|nr:2'-5' RNA ligase family protein [Gemmatimonadaceae bacterium]